MTAAHCFEQGFRKEDMTIIVGAKEPNNPRDRKNRKATEHKIRSVQIHPEYVHPAARYDLAILKIKGRPFKFTNSIWPICVPEKPDERVKHDGKGYNLVGFGRDINNKDIKGEILTQETLNVQVR